MYSYVGRKKIEQILRKFPDFISNFIINSINPVRKKIIKNNIHPKWITLFITNYCSARCEHCFYSKELNNKVEELNLENLKKIILFFQQKNQVSFVSTLKKMGKKNKNLLSFPENGYTITFDIKNNSNLKTFYNELEKILIKMNAKIYLTKDALMTKEYFQKTYLNINKFIRYKKIYDPKCKFTSYQSKRLGITK